MMQAPIMYISRNNRMNSATYKPISLPVSKRLGLNGLTVALVGLTNPSTDISYKYSTATQIPVEGFISVKMIKRLRDDSLR